MEPKPLKKVVGKAVARLRGETIRQQDLARAMRSRGLKWTPNVVSRLEQNDKAVSIEELVLLADSLRELLDRPVSLPELLGSGGTVNLAPGLSVSADSLAAFFSGEPVDLTDDPEFRQRYRDMRDVGIIENEPDEAERALARKLKVSPEKIQEVSVELWGRSLAEERDGRVRMDDGPSARTVQARRGRATTQLQKLIAERLSAGED